MARYLFLITIGPVQEFIAAARRTRDVWFGSWLLSELSRAAALAIPHYKEQLIFPSPDVIDTAVLTDNSSANVANKIVALIETDQITQVGQDIQQAVYHRLTELTTVAFATIDDWSLGDKDLAQKQVASFLECYWVAVPFPSNDQYKEQRSLLEETMAARKATRQFSQIELTPRQQRYPKSSLDGQRESIIAEELYPYRNDAIALRQEKLNKLFTLFGAKQAERLSGVDLLKRRGNYGADNADFPSTSHFAALPFIEHLVNTYGPDKVSRSFKYYRESLEDLVSKQKMLRIERLNEQYRFAFEEIENYDASILYISRLAEEIDVSDEGSRRKAEESLQLFLATAANSAAPKGYYAILQADGDSMGKVVDNQTTIEAHRTLSRQIALFAKEARTIVEQHKGALIYAGGDDVLAFLPISTVLDCAYSLHEQFNTIVGMNYYCSEPLYAPHNINAGNEKQPCFIDKEGKSPTLSLGIAICHHLEPLNNALELVRNAEKAAKQIPGKDALCIAIDKRSGEPLQIAGSWVGHQSLFTRLQHWLKLMIDDEFSAGAPYELRDVSKRLDEPYDLQDTSEETLTQFRAIAEEAGRIIERKRGQGGIYALNESQLNTVRSYLGLPEKQHKQLILSADQPRYSQQTLTVRQLAEEFIIARELIRFGVQQRPDKREGSTKP